tara:strand:+ start:4952 stop:5167 length:216 start_codon:yes stop_codon:yes gene_type:complete
VWDSIIVFIDCGAVLLILAKTKMEKIRGINNQKFSCIVLSNNITIIIMFQLNRLLFCKCTEMMVLFLFLQS